MPCDPAVLHEVPLFALLDEDELAVLAAQTEVKKFEPRQRIYRSGDGEGHAYVMVSGVVRVTTVDEDGQEVLLDEPASGEFFGFASMLEGTAHETSAVAVEQAVCVELDRNDIFALIQRKPHAAMDMLAVLGRQFHAANRLVQKRSMRNVNEMIEETTTFGERVADAVARFGGSWSFIIAFGLILVGYTWVNNFLGKGAWDPYPYILLNLFLSMLAAVQAPVIMMSQNRQDAKDRLRGELDFEVNRRAESEIQGLAKRLNSIGEQVADLEELVRTRR
jgi:uncharacterized membrane protein